MAGATVLSGDRKGKAAKRRNECADRAAFFWVLFFSAKEKCLASAAKQRAKSLLKKWN
jgi:hypothetical protein